jgi:hypothetical protein
MRLRELFLSHRGQATFSKVPYGHRGQRARLPLGASNDPSNDLPTPSNGVLTHTPHTPHPVGSGQGALEDAARSNGKRAIEDKPEWGS